MIAGAKAWTGSKWGVSLGSTALWAMLCLSGTVGRMEAQFAKPEIVSARSQSGQFIIHAAQVNENDPVARELATNAQIAVLDIALATVSCERIKQLLTKELGTRAPYRGKIYLILYSSTDPQDPVTITAEHFSNGWQYRVEA